MKKLMILLLFVILIAGCDEAEQVLEEYEQSKAERLRQSMPADTRSNDPEEQPWARTYTPAEGITIEELIDAYFEQQYVAYSELVYADLSGIIDMRAASNQNMVNWIQLLSRRRKLLAKHEICYVGTEMFEYNVEYEETPDDNRMEVWNEWLEKEETAALHFRIRGEEGKAYPPIMAVNSLHTMLFRKLDGEWKISMHYFPGSVRKFTRAGTITVPTEAEMLADLEREFSSKPDTDAPEIPVNAVAYSAADAVAYAKQYTEVKNPEFDDLGDWIGNCANFVSQAVWAGFDNAPTTGEWYAGSPPWVHVNYFWDCITEGYSLGGQVLDGVSALRNGDIVQVRTASQPEEPERYTHTLIVVDEEHLMLAQNTPAAFVYYSDLVNAQTRMIRPVSLKHQ